MTEEEIVEDMRGILKSDKNSGDFPGWKDGSGRDHSNRCGPRSLRGIISETGIHEFEHNAALGLRRMQAENLPLCIPVDDVPHDFDAFIRYVCQSLKIAPLDQILSPPWSPSLL